MPKVNIRREFIEAINTDPDSLDEAIKEAEFEFNEKRKDEMNLFYKECREAKTLADALKTDVDSLEYAFACTILQDLMEHIDNENRS